MTDNPFATVDSTHDPSIEGRLALRTSGTRLEEEFADTIDTETIETFLHSSYDQLATRASDGKPTVLILCTHNAGQPRAYATSVLYTSNPSR